MAKIKMIKEIKDTFPYYVALIKTGTFYKEYGKDSIIMNYLFNFKVKYDSVNDIQGLNKIQDVGFPASSLSKVLAKLEENRINYIIIDRNENYREIEKMDYRDKNRYQEKFMEGIEVYNRKYRFENEIAEVIKNNIDNSKVDEILNYISSYIKEKLGDNRNGKETY